VLQGRTRSTHDHFRTGVHDFSTSTVQFLYTCYMLMQLVLHQHNRVNDFGTVFGPFWYIMEIDSKKAANNVCVTDLV